MILFLGVVTSYEDIKFGKIRNKWILLGLGYFFTTNAVIILFFNDIYKLNFDYFVFLLLNGFLALIAGVLLWYLGLWTAGDAKLFFAFLLLLPVSNSNFNFDDVLINIFVPLSVILIIPLLFKIKKKEFFAVFELESLLFTVLFLFAAIWPISKIAEFAQFHELNLIAIFLILLFLLKFKKYNNWIFLALILLAFLRIIFDNSVYLFETWVFFALVLGLILIFGLVLTSSKFNKKDTISFAPFIFFGVLLQMLLTKNIVYYLLL